MNIVRPLVLGLIIVAMLIVVAPAAADGKWGLLWKEITK